MSTSAIGSTAPTVNTGNATDVSGLTAGSINLSLAESVTSKVMPYINQATAIQTEINTNQTQIAAYQSMQSLLQSLQSSVANLTNEPLTGTSAFNNRVANLSSNSAIAASTILSASVAAGTTAGSHTLIVNQLATAESDTSATLPLASSGLIGDLVGYPGDGSITIAEADAQNPVQVAINAAMTLADVADAINATSATNLVSASVVNVDASHQVLVLSGSNPDQQLNFTDSASQGILQTLGVVSSNLTGSMANPTVGAGSFTINAGGAQASVTLTAGESLATVASDINTAAMGTQIAASVNANNQLVITAASGDPLSFSGISGTALSSLGLANSGAAAQVTAPQAAVMTVDGVSGVTRTSNSVSDVLSGVTLTLTQAAPTTQVTVQIAPDTAGATTAVTNFVAAYNNWEGFVAQNEAVSSSGGAAAGAVLFGDATLRQASLDVDSALTQNINGTALGALGISLSSANQLTVNSTTLSQVLATDFTTAANFFQSSVTASSPDLQPSTTDFSSFAGSFTLGVSMSGSNISALTLNGSAAPASDFTFSGTSISGAAGSPYAGLYFTYTGSGTGASPITVTSTQGMANQIYTNATNYADPTVGSIQGLIASDQNQNSSLTANYNTWVTEANNYTNFLLQQYASLTTQIQNNGQTLNTLNALFTAQYGNG
jgi:flagellar hook-associated protein 2